MLDTEEMFSKCTNLWSSLSARWQHWPQVIVCCILDYSEIIFIKQNQSFSIWDKCGYLTIVVAKMSALVHRFFMMQG